MSWWDSLIVAAAQLQNCCLLLSEDLQNGATYGGVTVRNPFELGVAEARATYTAVPMSVPKVTYRDGNIQLAALPDVTVDISNVLNF